MARFAVVAPLNIVEHLDRLGILGNHHLLLAHDVAALNNQQRYFYLFHPEGRRASNRKPFNQHRTIIMDNSVIELGHSVDPVMLKDACDVVGATCVVLPDVLEDPRATLESCVNAVLHWDKYELPPYMMVPQGKTLSDFMHCAQGFITVPNIKWWGVPRNLVTLHGSRKGAIGCLFGVNPGRRIHLMGFSDSLGDDIMCAQMTEVDTIDSAVPLRASAPIESPEYTHTSRKDWWENAQFHQVIPQNLKLIRNWVSSDARPSSATSTSTSDTLP